MRDVWSSGDSYEAYVGRWSRLVAPEFIAWLGVPAGARWLDVGCGTGALTSAVLAGGEPSRVIGVDPSAAYVGSVRARVLDDRAHFAVADAIALGREDDEFDAVVSGLVLNFVSDPAAGVTEMSRVTRPAGTVAAYVWDYAEGMALMRHFWDAAVTLDPAAGALEESNRFPMCQPSELAALFAAGGLVDVATTGIVVPTRFRDFDDFWSPFLGGQGPAAGYAMSLGEDDRARLREHLRAALPIEESGEIPLTARAWAVRGTVPTA